MKNVVLHLVGDKPQPKLLRCAGVTLVELLVVITILGILAVTILPNIAGTIDSRRSREAKRGLSTFVARAQSRAFGAKEPKGFQIQPLSGNAYAAIDFFVADVPSAYGGELTSSKVKAVDLAAANPIIQSSRKLLEFSDVDTDSRVRANNGFCTAGDSIQFAGAGPYFKFTPGPSHLVSMWSENNQNPFNAKLPASDVAMPFRIRRQPTRSSTSIFQLTRGAALDLRWCSLGSQLFSSFVSFNNNSPAPITILFDAGGRPSQLVHSNGARKAIGEPIFLLLGLVELCGNGSANVSDANVTADPEDRTGANWQYVDATWLYIDHQSGLCRTAPSAAKRANSTGNVFDSQYNIREAIGLGARE